MPSKNTRPKRAFTVRNNPKPQATNTVTEEGDAPVYRFNTAEQVFQMCRDLEKADDKRAEKRGRIYRAYYRFPPTSYSKLVKLKKESDSNVNWGQLSFVVDSTMGSYYDMVTERKTAADIITKHGDDNERQTWSEHITYAFDNYALRRWDEYLMNVEQDQLDMGLYGKGVEFWDDQDGYQSEHVAAGELLLPDDADISLKNFDVLVRRRKYHLQKVWKQIRNKDAAEKMGWRGEEVVEAMRLMREDWRAKTQEEFLHAAQTGKIAFSSVLQETLEVYDVYVLEYDDTITRMMILRDRAPIEADDEQDLPEQEFLFFKPGYASSPKDLIQPFFDSSGSGEWHNTPSLAEKIFVQCRQYDITMNTIMDGIRMNMTLLLSGNTVEANRSLKNMVWGGSIILPTETQIIQQRVQMDVSQANETLRLMMMDMHTGIGNYQVQGRGEQGQPMTATQSQLDAAESAKLKGTQLHRYNEQQTFYLRTTYKKFVSLTRGRPGYENFEAFKQYLKDKKVPDEAWEWKNIESLNSNMLAGAGSPQFKLMAAQTIINLTNITPKDDGQRNAVEDAIAAVATRGNVARYMTEKRNPQPDDVSRIIGFENQGFGNPILNPVNLQVHPDDPHIRHLHGHLDDMAKTTVMVQDAIKNNQIDKPTGQYAMTKLLNQGGHVSAHMKMLAADKGKEDQVKSFAQDLNNIQRQVQDIQKQFARMMEAQQQDGQDMSQDPEIQKKLALAQIDVDTATKLANIKLSSIANSHQQRDKQRQDQAATSIAIQRAAANQKALQNGSSRTGGK